MADKHWHRGLASWYGRNAALPELPKRTDRCCILPPSTPPMGGDRPHFENSGSGPLSQIPFCPSPSNTSIHVVGVFAVARWTQHTVDATPRDTPRTRRYIYQLYCYRPVSALLIRPRKSQSTSGHCFTKRLAISGMFSLLFGASPRPVDCLGVSKPLRQAFAKSCGGCARRVPSWRVAA